MEYAEDATVRQEVAPEVVLECQKRHAEPLK